LFINNNKETTYTSKTNAVEGKGNDRNEKKHSLCNARVEIHASKDPFDTKGKKGKTEIKKKGGT
jgi:hypothetical protein